MDKLLIIEDDETIRNALRILLENQGYFIEEAQDRKSTRLNSSHSTSSRMPSSA